MGGTIVPLQFFTEMRNVVLDRRVAQCVGLVCANQRWRGPLRVDCGAAGGEATIGGDAGRGFRGLVMDCLVGVEVESAAVNGKCMMGFLEAPLWRALCKEHSYNSCFRI